MKKIAILLITLMLISVGFLSGCSSTENKGSSGGDIFTPKSNIIVTSETSRTGYEGIDFVFYIDVVVKNTGDGAGSAILWSEVNQDSNHYEKHMDVNLEPGKSESFTFKYVEFSFWSADKGSYRVWIE